MYNLTEYSEPPVNNAYLGIDNGTFNSQSFKYKAALVGITEDVKNGNSFVKNAKSSCSIKIFK